MARMPGAVWKPLPGSSTTRISAYDITCFHTMVGSLAGTDNYFRTQATGTNSHFGVGGDGTIYQWVDTAFRSGANLNGNYHIISAETADMGAPFNPWLGSDVPPWTQAQIEANAAIARWAHDTHGIPLTQIPDAMSGRRGVGYHRLGVPGYMVAGAEQWSTSKGKVCPGDHRISQVPAVIAAALGSTPTPTVREDDMRVVRTDNGTIWLITDTDVLALTDYHTADAAQKVWGGYTQISGAELDIISRDATARRQRLLTDVQRSVLCNTPSDRTGAWLWDRVAGVDDKTGALADDVQAVSDALGKVQSPTVDAAKLAAALLADDVAVAKLGEAIAAGLASRVGNG